MHFCLVHLYLSLTAPFCNNIHSVFHPLSVEEDLAAQHNGDTWAVLSCAGRLGCRIGIGKCGKSIMDAMDDHRGSPHHVFSRILSLKAQRSKKIAMKAVHCDSIKYMRRFLD